MSDIRLIPKGDAAGLFASGAITAARAERASGVANRASVVAKSKASLSMAANLHRNAAAKHSLAMRASITDADAQRHYGASQFHLDKAAKHDKAACDGKRSQPLSAEFRFNPNHDASGLFASGGGGHTAEKGHSEKQIAASAAAHGASAKAHASNKKADHLAAEKANEKKPGAMKRTASLTAKGAKKVLKAAAIVGGSVVAVHVAHQIARHLAAAAMTGLAKNALKHEIGKVNAKMASRIHAESTFYDQHNLDNGAFHSPSRSLGVRGILAAAEFRFNENHGEHGRFAKSSGKSAATPTRTARAKARIHGALKYAAKSALMYGAAGAGIAAAHAIVGGSAKSAYQDEQRHGRIGPHALGGLHESAKAGAQGAAMMFAANTATQMVSRFRSLDALPEFRYNPHHDGGTGRFTSSGSSGAVKIERKPPPAPPRGPHPLKTAIHNALKTGVKIAATVGATTAVLGAVHASQSGTVRKSYKNFKGGGKLSGASKSGLKKSLEDGFLQAVALHFAAYAAKHMSGLGQHAPAIHHEAAVHEPALAHSPHVEAAVHREPTITAPHSKPPFKLASELGDKRKSEAAHAPEQPQTKAEAVHSLKKAAKQYKPQPNLGGGVGGGKLPGHGRTGSSIVQKDLAGTEAFGGVGGSRSAVAKLIEMRSRNYASVERYATN